MTTPRTTRLVRTSDLQAFRAAVTDLARDGGPLEARDRLLVVPTRAAAEYLVRSIERRALPESGALVLPDMATARDLVARLADRLPLDHDTLTDAEREVLLGLACRAARASGAAPPFQLRAGLVAEILRFYDLLRGHQRDVATFERLALGLLEPGAAADRGAERLVRQTRFLVAAFRDFERRSSEAGLDRHGLRERLLTAAADRPYRHVVVTVGDGAFDPQGLSPADWDLLARLPGLERLDVVVTEATLAGAQHERLHHVLPGIEEVRVGTVPLGSSPSLVLSPSGAVTHAPRDREEEIAGFARRVKAAVRRGHLAHLDRAALVVHQPLPYVYLAREVFRSAGLPCQMFDALPLAAEPYVAALDLVFSAVGSGFARGPSIALLQSPHLRLVSDTSAPSLRAVAALDRRLAESGYLGEVVSLERLLALWRVSAAERGSAAGRWSPALGAGEALLAVARELEPLRSPASVADHVTRLVACLVSHDAPPGPDLPGPESPLRARQLRARGAVLGTLVELRDAFARFDPMPVEFDEVAALIRRWIDGHTFAPRTGDAGVHLVDAASARFGEFDDVQLAGLVEGEWPGRPRRSIFYSTGVLRELGWPAESDRIDGARGAFVDLLTLPSTRLTVSSFLLESDALVTPSPLLDERSLAQLPAVELVSAHGRVFEHEALSLEPVDTRALESAAQAWAEVRLAAPSRDEAGFRGSTQPVDLRAFSLSALERYQECPFKFFASRVLGLEEPADDESALSPKARGRFVHDVLQRFFEEWDRRAMGPFAPERLDDARRVLVEVAEPLLAQLPDADASLERTRLFGSAISAGIAETVLGIEATRGENAVVERWLEYRLEGQFTLGAPGGAAVALKGVADRIDLLPGHRLRVIDYKTGTVPNTKQALQVPIYALCAQERLTERDGVPWSVEEATYIGLRGKRTEASVVGPGGKGSENLAAARGRLLEVLSGVESGAFPPRPEDPRRCRYCAFSTVCRKDYVVTSSPRLPFDQEPSAGQPPSLDARIDARDAAARERAVDPRYNVALEASAGTGKTRVLVDRYINTLKAGVDPANILAITFTRKAAAEMRQRILATLTLAAERGEIPPSRWRELRDRTGDIAISTIDAFCLSLLREFPLEADLDPGFSMAEDTDVPRLVDESLDRALRVCRSVAREDENVALVFAQLGDFNVRRGLAVLLGRRIVAPAILERYLAKGPGDWDVGVVARRAADRLLAVFASMPGGLDAFLGSGPLDPEFRLLARQLRSLAATGPVDPAAVQAAFTRARAQFLTQEGEPRKGSPFTKAAFTTEQQWRRYRDLVVTHAPAVVQAYVGYRGDLNVLVSRGVWRMFRIAEAEYRRTLDAHALLDFSDVLLRALQLLRQMEEFSQSRYRLESRYHHVLVDEFQDTSRAQWELVSLLIESWGAGSGLAHLGPLEPSIFIVGDRKQSIYAFRDADVSVLHEAGRHLSGLRPNGDVRRSIARSFRSVPALLGFVNDVCADIEKAPLRQDAFQYGEEDRFPVDTDRDSAPGPDADEAAVRLLAAETPEACATVTATEIARLLAEGLLIRDRDTGVRRSVRAGDVAILFRTRESHREFEWALERHGVRSYVYKGLGFFDADEIKDVLALLWYLVDPLSDVRAAAWLRSRFVRLSDEGLRRLAPHLADSLRPVASSGGTAARLDEADARALAAAREAAARWRGLVDRLPPAELLDLALRESAYAIEMRGPRQPQARENLKKFRALMRRLQNRGYATLGRIVAHLDRLAVGDEANAVIDATDAVNLMTVHAAKGLEFPVVFVVNLARGTGNWRDPIRVGTDEDGEAASVAVGDFQSASDDDAAAREREETKRLLYVALTRARDRLYLGTVLKDGRMQPGRGSLAEVLPASLVALFSRAATGTAVLEWTAQSGAVHRFTACAVVGDVPDHDARPAPTRAVEGPGEGLEDDLQPIDAPAGPLRSTASTSGRGDDVGRTGGGAASERVLGALVHRLLQRLGADETDPARLLATASRLLRADEAEQVDREACLAKAVQLYGVFSARAEVREVYHGHRAMHEVPFTMVENGQIVRGTIDCLVQDTAGGVRVLEFKTGRPRPEHQAQAELYRRAAQHVFPGATVTARLVYAEKS